MRLMIAGTALATILSACSPIQQGGKQGAQQAAQTPADEANDTAVVTEAAAVAAPPASVVEALEPYYAGLGIELPQAPEGPALPAADQALTSIMFGSCHRGDLDLSILDRIVADEPDMFLYVGDNVYGDNYSWDPTLPELRDAYAELGAADPSAICAAPCR